MSRYIRAITEAEEYPDLPLAGQTIVHIENVPKNMQKEEQIERLKADLQDLATQAGDIFHEELVTDVQAKKGSIIIEIYFQVELTTLLSVENLTALKMYFGDEVINGVRKGTELYFAILTFHAIKRMERKMTKLCVFMKNYIFLRFSAARNIIVSDENDQSVKVAEGRTGVLGLLARLYDAANVCNSTSPISKREDAMKRVKNAIDILNHYMFRDEDRQFVCGLLFPLVKSIKEVEVEIDADAKNNDYLKFNQHREAAMKKLRKLCRGEGDE